MKHLLLVLLFPLLGGAANLTLVPSGATWKYLDNGSNQGTAWRTNTFNDSSWASGPAQLGYGDGGEATVVYGGPGTSRYITTYFRHAFSASEVGAITNLTLSVVRDDGVVVYLNGVEVYRNNMPTGTIGYTTLASSAVGNADESTFHTAGVSPARLVEGVNVLAVEIHQSSASSSDISFDLALTADRPDMTVSVNGPAPDAAGLSLSPVLDVSVSHRNNMPMTVTFFVRALPAVGPDFTIVAVPDTQFYTSSLNGGTPSTFVGQTEWIIANRVARNIAFVTQLGDCVQNGDANESEWWNVTNALYRLEDTSRIPLPYGIPYGVAVGNHDQSPMGSATGTSTFFNKYLGIAHFSPYAYPAGYYGGNYGSNNDEHFELFSASGMDFIIIHFEYDTAMTVNSPELDWADSLLKQHSNRQAILVAHYFMDSGENGSFGTQGAAVYNRLKVNPNLFMMLCGHVNPNGEGKRTDVYDGRTVYTLLSDYQDRSNGGNGWLRLLEFSPANSVIRVKTYSSLLNQYEDDLNSQFELPYDMLGIMGAPFTVASVNSGVTGGSTSAQLADLAVSTDYEWHVTVTDGETTVTSPKWRFRTADVTPPAAPSALTAVAQSSAEVLLSWTDNSPDETGFRIYHVTDTGVIEDGDVSTDSTNAAVAGLNANTTYHFFVRAFNQAGFSEASNTNSVTTLPPPPLPAAPSDLRATASNDTSVTLEWSDNATNESGFVLERSLSNGTFAFVVALPPNVINFVDSGLDPNTSYLYRIAATNIGGSSDFVVSAQVTTDLPPPPGVPQGVAAADGEGQISLSWLPSPGAFRYKVWRSYTQGEGYTLLGGNDFITATTYVDSEANLFQRAYYRISAVNDGGESALSAEVSGVAYALPAMPAGFANDVPGVDVIPLQWNTAADALGYRLERSTDGQTFAMIADLVKDPFGVQFYQDNGLPANTTFHYRLYATNEYGKSVPALVSGTTEQVPAPATPNGVSAVAADGSVTVSWLAVPEAVSYSVKRGVTATGPFTEIGGTASTTHTDESVVNGTQYFYVVSAINAGGESANSVAVSATPQTPPAAPTSLRFSSVTSTKIGLSWTDRSIDEQGFRIERGLSANGPFTFVVTVGADVRSYSDVGLTKSTTYFYRISAYNAAGASSYLTGSKKTAAK